MNRDNLKQLIMEIVRCILKETHVPKMFWIDPHSKIHSVPVYGHWETGRNILMQNYGLSYAEADKNVYSQMAKHGWFRLGLVDYQGKITLEYDVPRQTSPTPRQIKTIKDLGIELQADEVSPLNYA